MSYQKKQQQSRLSVKICALLLGLCLTVGMGIEVVSAEETVTNKLQNGSFEEEQTWTGNYKQPNQKDVPFWNTTATDGKIELFRENTGVYVKNVTLTPTGGSIAAELNAEEESTLYQNVKTSPSSIYEWGLDHGARNGTDTMALVIGPGQSVNPSKPSKDGRDQFMQMVDWLRDQYEEDTLPVQASTGPDQRVIVYSKKFAASGTFEDNAGNNAFSLTPSTIYTEEWHIWIIQDNRATSGANPWGSYGSNAEGSAGSIDGSGSTEVDLSKYYLYTVPAGQTETLFAFVSVGYEDSTASSDKAKTYGNFLDSINFHLYHPLSGSTTAHGSAVIGGSDGAAEGEGAAEGHEVTVDNKLTTYVTDGEPLKVQAVVRKADAEAGCEFVGLYYTTQDARGNPKTEFLQLAGNEIVDTGSLTDEEKEGKWIKSTNADGDTVYTYYLEKMTSPTDLHFVFIKNPTITYDPNGGKPYVVERTYNTSEAENVYSYKPVTDEEGPTITFIPPYVAHAAEGQNDGWKFMGWLLTGDTVNAEDIPSGIKQVNADELGSLLLSAEHTVACDYVLSEATGENTAQYFKIYDGDVTLTGDINGDDSGKVTGVTWTGGEGQEAYANVHKGLTMVAQWRWRQAFIPQVNGEDSYRDSDVGGTVMINGAEEEPYEDNGGKACFAATNEIVTATAAANPGYTFEGWYDEDGNLLTTNATYGYTETKECVNTCYARFSGSVTQTYIRQVKIDNTWTNIEDEDDKVSPIGTLDRYSYADVVGTAASSTAAAGAGYKFEGWYDSEGNKVAEDMLINGGATISYTTTGNATYYARFSVMKYTVTYDLNGGSGSISDTGTYVHSNVNSNNHIISVIGIEPTKADYEFDGWELVGGTGSVGASINVDDYWNNTAVVGEISDGIGLFTLRAKWEPIVTIYYVPIPPAYGSVSLSSETVGTGDVRGSTATANDGYYFVGWYHDEACTGNPVGTHAYYTPKKAAATYYAKFDTTKNVVITVTGNSASKVYDGTEHSVSGYTVAYTVNGEMVSCPAGIRLDANASAETNAVAKGTNVSAEGYTMALSDQDFTVDDTSAEYSYTLVVNPGKLIITARPSSGDSGTSAASPSKPVLNTEDHYSYIIGYKDGTLRPYGTITRGEVATIFFRLLTDETREEYWSQTNDYSDCDSELWCNNAISTLSNMGIIDGFEDGTFRPYAKITRAQFAKIAVGFFETTKEDYKGFFTDVSIGAWYTEYVEAAARVGLIQGFEDGTFQPSSNITRAQACVIVNRALNRKPDKEHLLGEDEMLTWVDNHPGDWFYADMQEATNSHDYIWLTEEQEMIEEWTAKLSQRDWAALEHAWSTAHSAPGGEVTR